MNPQSNDVDEILQLPEKIAQKKGYNIVVCIDEFQQIAEFKDSKTFQKRLRSVWQLQKSVSYCLFGSKKHLMNELFEKRVFPFINSAMLFICQKSGLVIGSIIYVVVLRLQVSRFQKNWLKRYAKG